ncbi:MAG: hypothetical protein WD049_04165 [Candidatus Paceibacterota bacterium]
MFRKHRLSKIAVIGAAIIAVAALACPTAEAQVKAFKISGEGEGPIGLPLPGQDARMHWVVGNATHLGRHYGEGTVQTDEGEQYHFDDDNNLTHITGTFGSGDGGFTFTAANGDKLGCHYGRADDSEHVEVAADEPGTFELTVLEVTFEDDQPIFLVEALWIAEFVPQPSLCTGRFAGVTGSWIMYAESEPFVLGSDDPVRYSWEGKGKLTFVKGKK